MYIYFEHFDFGHKEIKKPLAAIDTYITSWFDHHRGAIAVETQHYGVFYAYLELEQHRVAARLISLIASAKLLCCDGGIVAFYGVLAKDADEEEDYKKLPEELKRMLAPSGRFNDDEMLSAVNALRRQVYGIQASPSRLNDFERIAENLHTFCPFNCKACKKWTDTSPTHRPLDEPAAACSALTDFLSCLSNFDPVSPNEGLANGVVCREQ